MGFHVLDIVKSSARTLAAAPTSLQSYLTLWDPIDSSPPGSPIPGILQARTLEWIAISFSNSWKWKVKVKSLSRVRLLATPWTVAHQAPPSMGFSRQEYWSGVPLPSPKNIRVPVSFRITVFSGYRHKSRITMVVLFSDFDGTSTLFSMVAASIYILTTSSPTLNFFCRFLGDGHSD